MKTHHIKGSLLLAAALFGAASAHAAVFTLTDDKPASLIAAINAANSNNQDDIINLKPGAEYKLKVADNPGNGLPIILSDSGHKLTINGGTGAKIKNDTDNVQFRLLELATNADVTITGVNFEGGNLKTSGGFGGAIHNFHGSLNISGSSFKTCNADSGGAIYNEGAAESATLIISATKFESNSANNGGAIYSDGLNGGSSTVTISGSTLKKNLATLGGGIYQASTGGSVDLSISTSTIQENMATHGAGIYSAGSGASATASIATSTFAKNVAKGSGGAFYNDGRSGGIAAASFTNSTLSENMAMFGGGIFNDGDGGLASLALANTTFNKNSATGAAIAGGAVYNNKGTGLATVDIGNTILFVDGKKGGIFNGTVNTGVVTSRGYNLTDDDGDGVLVAPTDQLFKDPKFDGGLSNNGGPTQTVAIKQDSPARDQGKDFSAPDFVTPTGQDQRGRPRPNDSPNIPNAAGGDGSDIGAFERDGDKDDDHA